MSSIKTTYVAIIVVLVAGAAFFGGLKYQESKQSQARTAAMQAGNQRFGGRNGGQAFRPVVGDILSKDDKTITVKLMDGSSKIILYSATTAITKTDTGVAADLAEGTKIGVIGTTNSDGSVTAQNIQINPMFGNRPQGGQTTPSAQPNSNSTY